MNPWLQVGLIALAVLGVMLQVGAFVGQQLRLASGCLCAKGRWNPECPVHGRDAA